jgi:hypothetical protein
MFSIRKQNIFSRSTLGDSLFGLNLAARELSCFCRVEGERGKQLKWLWYPANSPEQCEFIDAFMPPRL